MKYSIIFAAIATTIFFAHCNSNQTLLHDADTEKQDHHEEPENTQSTSLTAEQMKSINIEFGKIQKKQLTASLKANGVLKVPNQNKANISAMLGGIIQTIFVQTGNAVKKDQVIATILNPAFISLQEEFLTTSSKIELAQLEYSRQKELNQGNAGALKNLQSSESELKMLEIKKASLEKQLELIGINPETLSKKNIQKVVKIKSPINGSISNVMVNIGSHVEPNNPIVEIVDNSQLHLDLYVYEKDFKKIKNGQIIHFTLTNDPGKEYDAEVYSISNTFEPNTKAITVHAIVKGNKQGLIDGMSITALVSLEKATVDAVPTASIVSHEGQDFIFIVSDQQCEKEKCTDDEKSKLQPEDNGHRKQIKAATEEMTKFEKIAIRKGTTDIGYSEITPLKEIPSNSKIVTNGAFFILSKLTNHGEGDCCGH